MEICGCGVKSRENKGILKEREFVFAGLVEISRTPDAFKAVSERNTAVREALRLS